MSKKNNIHASVMQSPLKHHLGNPATLNKCQLFQLFTLYWSTADEQCCDSSPQQNDSAVRMRASVLLQTALPCRLPRDTE